MTSNLSNSSFSNRAYAPDSFIQTVDQAQLVSVRGEAIPVELDAGEGIVPVQNLIIVLYSLPV